MDKLKQGSKVKWLTLGEIATNIYRGSFFPKNAILDSGEPCIRYAQLYEEGRLHFDNCTLFTDKSKIQSPKYCQYGDLLITATSNIGKNIAKACAYLGKEPALIDNICVVIKHNQNPKYLAYALSTASAQKQKIKLSIAAGLFNITFDSIKKIKIPIPSLEQQERIVNLLDKFWKLSKELEKELNLRKNQYEYYRDELLAFKQDNKIKWLTLGEIATDIYRGSPITKNQLSDIGRPCIKYGEIYTTHKIWFNKCISYLGTNSLKKYRYCEYGDLLFAIDSNIRENVGTCVAYLGEEKLIIDTHIIILKHNQNPKYLAYALSTASAQKQKIKLANINQIIGIDKEKIKKIKIPIPSLEEQKEIVNLLDKFWKISIDIKDGLPNEILLRKQQYEYYRDKLLKFEVLKV